MAEANYTNALALGIAKEQARALLPEGLTTSRMYMNGNMRSWIHYLNSRLHKSTQKEHRIVAQHITEEDIQALKQQFPDPNRLELLLTACQVEQ